MKIIDTHSHIDYITHDFQQDVVGTVCCAVQESDWDKIIELSKNDKHIYCTFGVHPWFIDSISDDFDNRLLNLLSSNSNYMVGEIGIDKHKPDIYKQIDVFKIQFDLAIRFQRTVFLHCVGAWDKILHILKQYKESELPMIVAHDFDANNDILNKLLKYKNIFFSLGKNSVYDRFTSVYNIPSDRILVETDAHKDIFLKDNIDKISDIKHDSNMWKVIYNNTKKVLNNG